MKGWGLDPHQTLDLGEHHSGVSSGLLSPSRTWTREQEWGWQLIFFQCPPQAASWGCLWSGHFRFLLPWNSFAFNINTQCVSAFLIRAAWTTPGSTSGLCGFSSRRCSPRLPTGITASPSVWLKSTMRLSGNSRKPASPAVGKR